MAWKPNRLRRCAVLQLEALESRSLLTLAAFSVSFYQDVGGSPGAVIVDHQLHVGEKFFAEISAQDVQPQPIGLGGISLDVFWNPSVVTEIDNPFDPSKLITPKLPAFQAGLLDNSLGQIKNLGGSTTSLDVVVGLNSPERFALLHYQALTPEAGSPFFLDPGRSGIAFSWPLWTTDSDFSFARETITVVAPSEPPPVASTAAAPLPIAPVSTAPPAATLPSLPPVSPPTQLPGTPSITPTAPTSSVQTPVPSPSADTPAVGLQSKLFTDNGGQPGSPIADNSVAVGDSFFVEIAAQDLRSRPQGIGGLSVNVSWNPAVLQEIDQPFNPAGASSQLVTAAFPLFRSGSLDNAAGQITDLGGVSFRSSGSGEPIGAAGTEPFSLLHFRALAAAPASPLALAIGTSGIGLVGETAGSAPTVNIAPQTVTVVAQRQPPQIAVTATSGLDPGTIQFTTALGSGPTTPASTLVRPALPDTKKFVDIKNTGGSPLTIFQIEINAPDVTTDVPQITNAASDLVLAPGETRRIGLTFAPSANDPDTQSFQVSNGLVIVSNAANTPRIAIALEGASTFDADINYDGRVNIGDIVTLDGYVGLRAGDANFDPSADPNGDGSVDLGDFGLLNVYYGTARASATPALLAPGSAASEAIASVTQSTTVAPLRVASSVMPVVNASGAINSTSAVAGSGAVDAVFGSPQADSLLPTVTTMDASDELAQALTTGGLDATHGKTNLPGSLLANTI